MVCNGVFFLFNILLLQVNYQESKYLHGVHPTNLFSVMVYGELHMEMIKNLILITINVLTGM